KDTAPLLDERLQNLRAKSSVHDRPRAPHLTLEARSCSGESSESAQPQPQCNECPPSDSGASVRQNEVLDGSNTLSHEKAAKGSHRDGAERPRLQYEACDDDPGRGRIAGGDAGVRPAFCATKSAPKVARFSHGLGPKLTSLAAALRSAFGV